MTCHHQRRAVSPCGRAYARFGCVVVPLPAVLY
nr:MAG TPA: hypothetical protein [Caudoviricetes sp.]